jgi:hypothetical protein
MKTHHDSRDRVPRQVHKRGRPSAATRLCKWTRSYSFFITKLPISDPCYTHNHRALCKKRRRTFQLPKKLILRNTPTRKSSSNAVKTSSWKSRICRYSDSSTRSAATNTNSTPGKDLEIYLNKHHGSGTTIYIEEGWAANIEIDGSHYRRSKIALPREDTRFFSITTVYMQSTDIFSGQYHSHPYGEINCVVQIDKSAELMGMQGWQGAGWTSPGPGTHQ